MNLNNVTLTVYKTSVSEESLEVTGNFTLTNTVRSGRTQIIEEGTDNKYWISNEDALSFLTPEGEEAIAEEGAPEVVDDEEEVEDLFGKEHEAVEAPSEIDEEMPKTETFDEEDYEDYEGSGVTYVKKPDVVHIVKRGETVTTIANKYGVSVYDIMRMAGVEKPAIGQRIVITK